MFNEMLKTILGLFLATVIVVIILHFAIAGVVKPEIGQAEETAPATSAPTEPETEPTELETTPETTAPTEPSTEPSPTETQATEPTTPPTAPRETEPPTEATTPETEPPATTVPPTEATTEATTEPVTEPTEAPTEETEPTTEPEEEWKSLGAYTLTAYCSCQRCCGKAPGSPGYGITASGATAVAGVTIAVDPSVIPFGSEVKINDHTYIAQDTGGAINGSRIDVYFDDHQEALNFGRQSAEVFIRA